MDKEVKIIIEIFNQIFLELNQKPLLENSEFKLEKQLDSDWFKRFYSVKKTNRPEMMFEISSSQLEFWIEGTNELPYWTIQEITSDTENIKNEIK